MLGGAGAERRINRRFDLSLPVKVRVQGPEGKAAAGLTFQTATRDISARGLYLTVSQDLSLGTELECELTLPPELCQGNTILIRCRGRIVRVERREAEDAVAVAATIEDYEFVKTE